MAERRMFSRNLVQTDRFLDLAPIAQALYFQLCLAADDDGFLSNVKSMARMVGAAPKDLTDLEAGGYLIRFPSGVAVIRHWLVHNSIRKDRYTPTLHQEERAMLTLGQDGCWERKPEEAHAAEGGEEAGTEEVPGEGIPEAPGCPSGSRTAAQDGPGQVRTEERARKGEHEPGCQPGNQTEAGATRQAGEGGAGDPPSREAVLAYARKRESPIDADRFYDYYSARNWKMGQESIRDWQAALRCWESRERERRKTDGRRSGKILPAQDYKQRDYSADNESLKDTLARMEATMGRMQ